MGIRDIVCIAAAYLLGGVCAGYYLVRMKTGQDIREQGSGGVGARNVGRVLGRSGFVATLLGDALKGILAVVIARTFSVSEPAQSAVVVAVIAGHIWPLPLQFRGGRGIATAIGALLVFAPGLALLLLVMTLMLMIFRRGFIISGLAAFALLPLAALALSVSGYVVAALAGCSAMVLFAHRERICRAFAAPHIQEEV
jgi:glycerol-3-phosphate acyltransferase PlsY